MLQQLAIRILGLEPTCYAKANVQERSFIVLVLVSFMAVVLSCMVSMFVIGLFVSGSVWWAIPISILGSFVFVSIFRFSLILIKPELNLLVVINESLIKTTIEEKFKKLIAQIGKWKNSLLTFRFNSNWAIPGFTVVFRLLYLGLLAFVLIFPLTTLTQWSNAMEYNQALRNQSIRTYNFGVDHLNTRVVVKTENEIEAQKAWYANKMNNAYFTMRIFTHSTNYPTFTLITFFVCFGLFLPHAMLFIMMRSKQFVYQSSVRNYFKTLIEQDFVTVEYEAKKYLSKYQGFDPNVHLKFISSGNPYKQKSEFTQPQVMTYAQYVASKNVIPPQL